MEQIEKARTFAALHVPGNPLVLFNAWDASSARAVARSGAKAIATGSASVAAANGYRDGEEVPLDFVLTNARHIVEAVDLPVTVDFEGGYAAEPEEVSANVARLAATGAIGCNFEDQIVGGDGIHRVEEQAARISAIRTAVGPDFFINARTDLFLKSPRESHNQALADAAIERANAYSNAGASGFFVPALVDLQLMERITQASPLPVNAMAVPEGPTRKQWAEAGVARVSHGPFPHMRMLAWLEESARAELA